MRTSLYACMIPLCFFLLQPLLAQRLTAEDRIGERAVYKLNRDSSRTSWLIRSGTFRTEVVAYNREHEKGPVYRLSSDYTMDIRFAGKKEGNEEVDLSEELFTEDFMTRLRAKKQIKTRHFTTRYLGQKELMQKGQQQRVLADQIEITDVDLNSGGMFAPMLEGVMMSLSAELCERQSEEQTESCMLQTEPLLEGPEDIRIRVSVKQGMVPVLGVLLADISLKWSGVSVKVGFDLDPEQSSAEVMLNSNFSQNEAGLMSESYQQIK
ncbi:MAG: hypothetical protein H6618_05195 [Deltaproteobacteria bacterium]|nr:hypothetical protein [Deltaproteobacteria bacterium]